MKIKSNTAWTLLAPTSMGVRICPLNGQPVQSSDIFRMQATSAESNVLSVPSYLGMKTKILTAFVKGSPIAEFIKRDLRSRGITYEAKEVVQGGPWGYRHQFNIADSGCGMRGPRVCNDRAGEVGRTLSASDFDLERIFGDEGVGIVHISGLICAMSESTAELCLKIAESAKKHGTLVSFDLNYRASFWAGREEELHRTFSKIASLSDILIGNEEDFQLSLGFSGPETGGNGISGKIESFKSMIMAAKKKFPDVSVFATTLREVKDANCHVWGAIMMADGEWYTAEPREITVLDRIGGGDGFVGGLLYGIAKGWETEKCLEFGWASGAMTVTFLTDYAQPTDEEQIWEVWRGNARVKR